MGARIVKIVVQNRIFLTALVLLTLVTYANAIPGDFSMVDDITGIVENAKLADFSASVKTFHLQTIIYSLIINTFKLNPVPFHWLSLLLHGFNVVLAFILLYLLFGKTISRIAALIFAVHPVNTEAVTWISGDPYLINAVFFLSMTIVYYGYKQTNQIRYLLATVLIYSGLLIFTRTPFALTFPVALMVIDQWLIEPRLQWRSAVKLLVLIIPMGLYVMLFLNQAAQYRQSQQYSHGLLLNQQALIPVVESYPYTIYSLVRLYGFPKRLVIYYDGQIITPALQLLMYLALGIYALAIIYFWKKKRQIAGLLILLIVLIAPTFTPVRVTWYIAERYLYLGSAFFGVIVALGIIKVCSLLPKRRQSFLMAGMTGLIVALLAIRTVLRNQDYLDAKTFAQRTVKDAPYSARPYDDLGSVYYLENNYQQALYYFRQALTINPTVEASMNNIGLIYLKSPPDQLPDLSQVNASALTDDDFSKLSDLAWQAYNQKEFKTSAYFVGEALRLQPDDLSLNNLLGDLYLQAEQFKFAQQQYLKSIELNPQQSEIFYKLGYTYFQQQDLPQAKKYLQKTLELDPENSAAKNNLQMVESELEK